MSEISMQTITASEFKHLCDRKDLTLLKTTYNRPKLYETSQGEIIKIFYPRKKTFSSNQYHPYALRFVRNAMHLKTLGLNTPDILAFQHCPELNVHLIRYKKLPGINARLLSLQSSHEEIIFSIAKLIADLHQKGIFFRSIHLENLLVKEDGQFALLDIVDVQFKKRPLSIYLRLRNLKHLFKTPDDQSYWTVKRVKLFLNAYLQHAHLFSWQAKIFYGLPIYLKFF